ncbi:hypothetical protein BBJ28_00019260, partial [Nothophytophthora sp. Chile5]
MHRATEFTPLLPGDGAGSASSRHQRRRWQYVVAVTVAAALCAGLLSLVSRFQFQGTVDLRAVRGVALPRDAVELSEAATTGEMDDAAFLQSVDAFKDAGVDPCEDFYQYACGGWLATHEIPADRASIDSAFYVVAESNKRTIQQVLDEQPPQISELYASCLNDQEVDADAVAYVASLIDNIHHVNSTLELLAYAGELDQSLGISTFFNLDVAADPEDPSTNVLQLAQGGLTLPSREYYLEQSKVDAYAALFVEYVTKLFAVGDLDHHNVSVYAQAVLETETKLAEISLPNAALRDPWTTNTAYPFAEIAQRYPFLMAYVNGIYKQEPFPMLHAIVATPDFFSEQNKLLSDDALLPELKNYLSFHLIDSFAAVLGEYFRRASHDFHGTIQGAGAMLPRDQFCVSLTTSFLGDELGEYYMRDVFGPDAKAAAQALVTEIEESLKALLITETWLDKITYDAAVVKLDMVKNYIGGPDVVLPLPFTLQADAFFSNVRSLMQLSATQLVQSIGAPVDPQAWDMFPSTVNAYYDPSSNKMVFPAAILQPPFYSPDHFPAAANFARIGMVMGHELSHGFDDQGRNYDGNGALRSWWTPSVSAEFTEKAQCLAAQYSSFPVVSVEDGHVLGSVNGNLTLGENIADNGGIHLAYEAYHLWRSTLTEPLPVPATPTSPAIPPEQPVPAPDVGSGEDVPAVTPPPPVAVPGTEEPTSEPSAPIEVIPVLTLPPPALVPAPDESTPVPSTTKPGTAIPAVTPPPPAIVPPIEESTPEPSAPIEVIPVLTLPPPALVPAPDESTPVPSTTKPGTAIPAVTPPPPAIVPPIEKSTPEPSVVVTPPPPTSLPPPAGVLPEKHHDTKKHEPSEPTSQPEREGHDGKDHHHHPSDHTKKGEGSEKSKPKHSKSDKEDGSDSKHSTEKHKEKQDEDQEHSSKKKHDERDADKHHSDKDEGDHGSSKAKHSGKHDRDDEGDKHGSSKHIGHKHGVVHGDGEEHTKKQGEEGDEKHESKSHHQGKHHTQEGEEDRDTGTGDGKHHHAYNEGENDRGGHEYHHRHNEEKHHENWEHHKHREEEEGDDGENGNDRKHIDKHHRHDEPRDRRDEESHHEHHKSGQHHEH